MASGPYTVPLSVYHIFRHFISHTNSRSFKNFVLLALNREGSWDTQMMAIQGTKFYRRIAYNPPGNFILASSKPVEITTFALRRHALPENPKKVYRASRELILG